MMQGRLEDALQVAARDPNDEYQRWAIAMIQHAMGKDVDSKRTLAEMKRRFPTGDDDGIAWVYAVQGNTDDALTWFDKAYEHRNNALAYLKCMPEAPAFTRDPRYRALLRKMKLPES
jgi:tetratricopeptide (TPR) repeat protein